MPLCLLSRSAGTALGPGRRGHRETIPDMRWRSTKAATSGGALGLAQFIGGQAAIQQWKVRRLGADALQGPQERRKSTEKEILSRLVPFERCEASSVVASAAG